MNELLVNEIKQLYKQEDSEEQIRTLLTEHLKKAPYDTEAWLRLSLVENSMPFANTDIAIEYIKKVLEYDQTNVKAILILSYIKFYDWDGIDDSLYERLIKLESLDNEEQSMIEFVKAWKFMYKTDYLYKKYLLKSVLYCNSHVWNHEKLAQYYLDQENLILAEHHVQQAVKNVRAIYRLTRIKDDYSDVDEFLSERIKGVYLSQPNFKSLEELLENIRKRKAEKI